MLRHSVRTASGFGRCAPIFPVQRQRGVGSSDLVEMATQDGFGLPFGLHLNQPEKHKKRKPTWVCF